MDHNTRSTTWTRPSPAPTRSSSIPSIQDNQSSKVQTSSPQRASSLTAASPSVSPTHLRSSPITTATTATSIIAAPIRNDAASRNTATPTATAVALSAGSSKAYTAVAVVVETGYNTNTIAVNAVSAKNVPTAATLTPLNSSFTSAEVEGFAMFRENDILQALGELHSIPR